MTDGHCETCAFFLRWSQNLIVGHCHRFPPEAQHSSVIDRADQFPVVSGESWCGEYRLKSQHESAKRTTGV